ncbi:MAG TPA: hypothetical protein DHW82_10805, partial [Spirochaetia bacterium]|nr:hypothetical protein [Spirochaetia bacterium]
GYKSLKFTSGLDEIYAEMKLETQVQGQKITVTGKKDEKRVAISKQTLKKEELKKTTSSIFEDSVKVIQTLPGVVSLGFSSEMYIRGGDSYEFSSFYDHIYLTNPYILGGALTVFNPDIVNQIDFYTGAFPAEFNNGMSGVLDVKMRDGDKEKFTVFVELSITSVSALFEGPLGGNENNNDSFLVSFRRTYYDLAAKLFFDDMGVQLPFFYDTHIRFKIQLNPENILRIYSLGVYEGVDIKYEDFGKDRQESANFKQGSKASFLNIRALQGISLTSALSPEIIFENSLGYIYRYADLNFYSDPNRYLIIKPSEHYFQYRGDLSFIPNENHILKTGIGLYGFLGNLDLNIFLRGFPSGIPYNPPPYLTLSNIPTSSFEQEYRGQLSLFPTYYLQDDIQILKDTLFLSLGGNFQYFNLGKGIIADPRIGFKLKIEDFADFKLAGGQYSQYPITKEFGRVYDKKYGNPDLKPEKSYHLVFSAEKDFEEYFIRSDVFGKYYKDLVTEDYQANFINGEIGYSYGFEFFLQKKLGKDLDGWISYTYVITQRKITNRISKEAYNQGKTYQQQKGDYKLPFDTWYSPEYDRRHSINVVLNYTFTQKWRLSTTFKFGTGVPYTDVTGNIQYGLDTDGNTSTAEAFLYNPVYGGYNQSRYPYYMNLDIKLSMPFFWDNWSAYIQVINALWNKNIQGYSYDPTYTQKRESTGIPIPVPIFGIRAEF